MQGQHGSIIAIVDDDNSLRDALRSLIASAGYHTRVFESASAFLVDNDRAGLACVVLDVHMPGLSGLALQRRLLDMNVSLPIIFLTASAADLRTKALAQGAVAVLGKPFNGDQLLSTIQKVAPSAVPRAPDVG
jgi:FixJ family two-component response regulator